VTDDDPIRWAIPPATAPGMSAVVDRERGTRIRASFLPTAAGKLFCAYHEPSSGDPRGAVVVCSPVLAEASRNYRREMLLAEALAEAGFATSRFHYRGTGYSDDAPAATLQDLVEDAEAVAHAVQAWAGVEVRAFVGTRLGAVVAALAQRRYGPAALVLWDAAISPDRYLRDVLRARLMTEVKAGTSSGGMAALRAQLDDGRLLEVSGYQLTPELYGSVARLTTDEVFDLPTGPLLMVEMNGRARVRSGARTLIDRWRAAGQQADVQVLPIDEPWWFGASSRSDTYEARTTGLEAIDLSIDHLLRTGEASR
jgi:alpha/beta superfamily hydrolase